MYLQLLGEHVAMAEREQGTCPVCGIDFQERRAAEYRERDGEIEEIPGIIYRHEVSHCVEWADRKVGNAVPA